MKILDNTLDIKKRTGSFQISHELLLKHPDIAMKIFAKCIIVRAESLFINNSIEYNAYSPLFDEVDDGVISPEYLWVAEKLSNGQLDIRVERADKTPMDNRKRRMSLGSIVED